MRQHGGGRPPSVRATGETFLTELIDSQPDLILEEIRDEYNDCFEPVGRSTIDRTLTRLKLTRKKRVYLNPEKIPQKINKNNKIIKQNSPILKKKTLFLLMKRVASET